MTPSRDLWAKSSRDGKGHTLLGHLLDVGLVAQLLLGRARFVTALRRFADDLGLDPDRAMPLAVVLAALHDIGKASPIFQRKWPEGAPPEALEQRVQRLKDVPHGTVSAIFLKEWLRDRGMHGREAETLAHAIGVHHGIILPKGFDSEVGIDEAQIGQGPWIRWRLELAAEIDRAFGPLATFERRKGYRRVGSWAFLAGLTSVADWIGSGLPHTGQVDDVVDYLSSREHDVDRRMKEIGWPLRGVWWAPPPEPATFASWFEGSPAGAAPRALQIATEDALSPLEAQQALVIIEAPTGEGKTEAAFFASVRLNGTGGAYFGLPTRATSDALYGRLAQFVRKNNGRAVRIALAHGAARAMNQDSVVTVAPELAPAADYDRDAVDPEGQEAIAIEARWFSMGRKELLAELGAGTADQALLGVLPARHHFVKLWAMAGKVIVFDEVHAYDTYTGGLVRELIRWLAWLGSSVIVMSATLPGATRLELVDAFQNGAGLEPTPPEPAVYPRLTVVASDGARTYAYDALPRPNVKLRAAPFAVPDLGDYIKGICCEGGAVGVIVNSVQRAQQLFEYCRHARLPALLLLHARFPLSQRKVKEEQLLSRYGPESTGRRDGVVIATQVMEQSLDVDFDVMITDLAPIDLVLQRSGRMFRHVGRKDRGPHDSPVLHVAGLGDRASGPETEATDTVYDPFIVWRSWASLVTREVIRPADVDFMVQRVYDVKEPIEALGGFTHRMEGLEERHDSLIRVERVEVDAWLAGRPTDDAPAAWRFTATDADQRKRGVVVAPTRLGDRSVTMVPVYDVNGRWLLPSELSAPSAPAEPFDRDRVRSALEQQISTSNKHLVRRLESATRPAWWNENKLLRFVQPLVLGEDHVAMVDPSVRLDPDLGLVLGRPGREGRRGKRS